MKSKNVLYVLKELKFSGAEIMYVDAAEFFIEKGCALTVIAIAPNLGEFAPSFLKAGYRVLHMPFPTSNPLALFNYYINFIRFLKRNRIDVVHNHCLNTILGMALCAWFANIKCVYTLHNVYPTRAVTYPYHFFSRWIAKNMFSCKIQSISDSVYKHELKLYFNKTIKIYNWYGSRRFYPAEITEKQTMREKLGIDQNAYVIISVGGCSPVKRHSDIINALPIVLKELPNSLYLHLGEGCSTLEELQLANDLFVANKIRFCGNRKNVRDFLITSDVYVMPSRFEGIPITTIEAMACSIPAILYDVPGLRDFNNDGENCILIPEDYSLLAEKILFLQRNKRFTVELTTKGRLFVNKYFDMRTNLDKIYDLYN